jgi:hypothetical protein
MLQFRNVQHKTLERIEGPRPRGEISGVWDFGHSMVKRNAQWRSMISECLNLQWHCRSPKKVILWLSITDHRMAKAT